MFRVSSDLRFVKNRDALRRAYIDLVKEKGTGTITVKELAARANVNRMTFYSHYDTVNDILAEYVDDMTTAIIGARSGNGEFDIAALLEAATQQMQQEIDFFRLVARDDAFEAFRSRFRDAFKRIFEDELGRASALSGTELKLTSDMIASGVTYAFLDWLAGEYGDLELEALITHFEQMLKRLA